MGEIAEIVGFIVIMVATVAIAGGGLAFAAHKQNQSRRNTHE